MKKISVTVLVLCFSIAAQAQEAPFDPFRDRQVFFDCSQILAVLAVIYLVSSFIVQMVRQYYTFRIKNRILDRGTEENIVRQLIQPEKKENRNYILLWFFMLAALGVGIISISLTRPFGLHSFAILAFSMAAGFGAYYYFTRQEAGK
jgi:hypothetical protein